jgi:hypothetical protein
MSWNDFMSRTSLNVGASALWANLVARDFVFVNMWRVTREITSGCLRCGWRAFAIWNSGPCLTSLRSKRHRVGIRCRAHNSMVKTRARARKRWNDSLRADSKFKRNV